MKIKDRNEMTEIMAAITWDVNPDLLTLGPLKLRYYGILWALSFLIGYYIMFGIYKREGLGQKEMDILLIYMVIGSVIGARLGHILFYDPQDYLENPLRILYIWQGGLASHGGAVGVLLVLWLYTRKLKKINYMWLLDRIVITVALAGCFIRLGNLFNSEIYGLETDLPWGFIFVQDNQTVPRHPTQIYEALCYLVTFVYLYISYFKMNSKIPRGQFFGIFLILVFGARFFIEFVKENQVPFEETLPLNMGQLLSVPLVIIGAYFLVASFKKKEE